MTSKPVLYSVDVSPPVRAVRLTAEAIGLELDVKQVDLFNGEHLKEEYLKINPQHTVPTLDDNGDVIWDSHAIVTYLVDKYAPNDALYPKDLVKRARVDQRLHFDSGVLFQALRGANTSIYFGGAEVPQDRIDALHAALELLETFLKDDKYLVGNSLTVADLCCLVTVVSFELHFPIESEKYPKVHAWIERLKELPYVAEDTRLSLGLLKWFNEKKEANRAAKEA